MSEFIIENGVLKSYKGTDETVKIPDGVSVIDEMAFYGNNTMREIVFPDTVKEIRRNAFSPCNALERLDLPEGLEVLGDFAFSCCRRLKEISFSSSLSKIGRSAFSMCRSIREIVLPDRLEELERGAFLGCTGLREVTLGKNVRLIDAESFADCTNLTKIIAPEDNPYLACRDGVVYSRDMKTLLVFPGGLEEIIIPDGTEVIGARAFQNNNNVDRLALPETLREIGESAFLKCTRLLNIEFPEKLERIGALAFRGCRGLKGLFIPDRVSFIGESAFRECRELMWLRLPEGLDFDLHWFSAPNDEGALSADQTIVPFASTRPCEDITSRIGKKRAAEGFVMAENAGVKTDDSIAEGYLSYIRENIRSWYDILLEDESTADLLCRRKLVPEDDIEELLALASQRGAAGAGAILLNYQSGFEKNAGKKEIEEAREKQDKTDRLEERFSALEKALDLF